MNVPLDALSFQLAGVNAAAGEVALGASASLQMLMEAEAWLEHFRPTVRLTIRLSEMAARGERESDLHRFMARLGYVPELLAGDGTDERWLFVHPDGPAS
jgi:hypothetical protein